VTGLRWRLSGSAVVRRRCVEVTTHRLTSQPSTGQRKKVAPSRAGLALRADQGTTRGPPGGGLPVLRRTCGTRGPAALSGEAFGACFAARGPRSSTAAQPRSAPEKVAGGEIHARGIDAAKKKCARRDPAHSSAAVLVAWGRCPQLQPPRPVKPSLAQLQVGVLQSSCASRAYWPCRSGAQAHTAGPRLALSTAFL